MFPCACPRHADRGVGGVPRRSLSPSSETGTSMVCGGLGGPTRRRARVWCRPIPIPAMPGRRRLIFAWPLSMVVGLHILHGLPIQTFLTLPHRQICRPRLVICFSFLYTGSWFLSGLVVLDTSSLPFFQRNLHSTVDSSRLASQLTRPATTRRVHVHYLPSRPLTHPAIY
ncbi:hypothetical protein QBC47DRAFT_163230 [Echria macrotheca]|uniref:Uncharacterized protein n=1 Tax=Echria macrotheca TaxID=438768 RepID=A0AAJ0FDJ2_9PEZI|nr:hypothetical protein QBC47DRAFT_163230 [Echria macrotheca]